MNLVTLPRSEGEPFALNADTIVALVPEGAETHVHTLSGQAFVVALSVAALTDRLALKGWRKGA